ncbi:MAG: hypothetical protein U9O56_01105 [Campylobacterota bacterium]|nr:hypothetical protein [Campylobacterota bacterium]
MKKLTTSILLASSLLVFNGCKKDIDVPTKPSIDINIPVVDSSTIKYISDYKSIALEWKNVTNSNIRGYYIYRANMQHDGNKFKRVATLKNKYQTHYLDKGLESNSKYSYGVSVIGQNGTESTPSRSIIANTLPNFKSVSLITAINQLPRQVKILWRPHTSPRVSSYILERTSPTTSKWEKIAEIKDRYNVEYIDNNLGDNEIYMYRIRAVTFDGIISNFSDTITGTTKSLPSKINKLSATKDLPQTIQLSWTKSPTKDVIYYNIYRSSSVDGSFSKIAKARVEHNRFDDKIQEDDKIYFYKITTVDKDNLESDIKTTSPIMGSTLSKPKMPRITLAQIQGNKIILNWENSDDRAKTYNIYKTTKDGWNSSEAKLIPNVSGLRFEDNDIVRGVNYQYSIEAVDIHGIKSLKTEEVSQKLPVQNIKIK